MVCPGDRPLLPLSRGSGLVISQECLKRGREEGVQEVRAGLCHLRGLCLLVWAIRTHSFLWDHNSL